MSKVFFSETIVICVILFASFCWFLDVLLEILKLKKKKSQIMPTETSGQI